jgi:hypothetical protein
MKHFQRIYYKLNNLKHLTKLANSNALILTSKVDIVPKKYN